MAGLVLTSVTRIVQDRVMTDEDQVISEKIAAYWDFLSKCAQHDMYPMSDPDITMDTDFYGQSTIIVTGWAFHTTPIASVCELPDPYQQSLFGLLETTQATSRRAG